MGLVNALGNVGGYLWPGRSSGILKSRTHGMTVRSGLGGALLAAAALCFLLPKSRRADNSSQAI